MSGVVEKKRSRLNWQLLLKIGVTVAILAVTFRKTDWSGLWHELTGADSLWLSAAFLCIGVGLVGTAVRWDYLLRVQEIRLPVIKVWIITMIGIFFNQFLLGSTGGDVIKVFYIVKQTPERKARAALSILVDRVLGLLAMLLVILLLLPWELRRLEQNRETHYILLILGLILLSILGSTLLIWLVPLQRLPAFLHRLWAKIPYREMLASLYEGFHAHSKASRAMGGALLWTAITVSAVLSTGYLISRALHLDIGYAQMTILFTIILCAISLPISVSGHGVREGMFSLLFAVFAVTRHGLPVGKETALACSILFFGLNLIWGLIGGMVYLGYSHALKSHESDP